MRLTNKNKRLQIENWSRQDLVNEINRLEELFKESRRTILNKANKINRLEADLASVEDYSDKQADVIKHYVNQIEELRDKKQNSNDSRKFYWAEEVK